MPLQAGDLADVPGGAQSAQTFYAKQQTDRAPDSERFEAICEGIAHGNPSTLLDLACGRGDALALLQKRFPGIRYTGADIAPASVEATRARGFSAQVADAAKPLPFPDGSFDCVLFGEVIEHLNDPDFALGEIARVLCPGGTIVVTTPNIACWMNRILVPLGVQPVFTETSLHANLGRRLRALGQWGPVQGHLKVFTLAALCEMLRAHRFDIKGIRGAPFHPPNRFTAIDRMISKIPAFASDLIVWAESHGDGGPPHYPPQAP